MLLTLLSILLALVAVVVAVVAIVIPRHDNDTRDKITLSDGKYTYVIAVQDGRLNIKRTDKKSVITMNPDKQCIGVFTGQKLQPGGQKFKPATSTNCASP